MTAPRKPRAPRKPPPFRLTAPEPLEGQVQKQITDFLGWNRDVVFWWRSNAGAGQLLKEDGTHTRWLEFNFKGCPDLCGYLRDGTALFIEVKRPSVKKARPEQEAFLTDAAAAGCVAVLARDDMDVKIAIENHFRKKR